MIKIRLEGVDELMSRLDGFKRNIPYALANGVNAVARLVKDAEREEMQRSFKSPTPFTLNSVRMKPAKAPFSIDASVFFKDPPNLGQKEHYLLPQVEGGDRPLKPYEMGLGGQFTTPGKGLKLDQYGNLGRGQLTKILSQSGSFRESGFRMNKIGKRSKAGDMFMLRQQRGKMLPGIYERVSTAAQLTKATRAVIAGKEKNHTRALKRAIKNLTPRGIRPVLIFPKKAPTYGQRFDFYGVAKRVIDQNLAAEMAKAIDAEISSALAYRARKGL